MLVCCQIETLRMFLLLWESLCVFGMEKFTYLFDSHTLSKFDDENRSQRHSF